MFTGMPYALRGKKEIEVIKASTEVAGFVRACCQCSWMQPATRDLTAGKLGLDKAKFLVREESRLGRRRVPPRASGPLLATVIGALLPAARRDGGREGLRRCRQGGLARPSSDRVRGAGGRLDIWNG
jgi:hypothetical protein